ncbi:MAG: hypothetical protein J1F05_05720 [Muribaculaceae bacterium]|nr:hypothetical protein [Muribaculaceae bacterium]
MNTTEIQELINRFLDGETSIAEENKLYDFFSSRSHLGELEEYRAMFNWYSSLPDKSVEPKIKRHWSKIIAVAATMAILIAIGITAILLTRKPVNELYECYKGSYAIVDGKRYTDIAEIYDRLIKAEAIADSIVALPEPDFNDDLDIIIINNALNNINDSILVKQIRSEIFENS